MAEFTLPSGAKLLVTLARFRDANELNKALIACLKGVALPKDPSDFNNSVIKEALVKAMTSSEVEASMFLCLGQCTYNEIRVTHDLFDDPKFGEKARTDYYPMCLKVAEVNCQPFFVWMLSAWKAYQEKIEKSRSSPSI